MLGEPGAELRFVGAAGGGEARGEGVALGGVVSEREGERGRLQEKVEGIGVEGFDHELGAEFEAGGGVLGGEPGPVEGVVLGVAGGDASWRRGDVEFEIVEALTRGFTRAQVEGVGRERDGLRVVVARDVGEAEEHGGVRLTEDGI